MTPIELRYKIYKALIALSRPEGCGVASLESPEPGADPSIKVSLPDPYRPGEYRFYRITVAELEGEDS